MTAQLLESWDRQARIINSLAALVDEDIRDIAPAEDRMTLHRQLCHIAACRKGWLEKAAPSHFEKLQWCYQPVGEEWEPIEDLAEVKREIALGGRVIREAVEEAIEAGTVPFGPYDHPAFYLQHMLWHEGWHAGMIVLGLKVAGREPTDEWEEQHIWELWRGPE